MPTKKRILFIHNAEKLGGSAKSLILMIKILMLNNYECIVLLRERDEGSLFMESQGIKVVSYPFLFQVGFTISDRANLRARFFRPFRLLLSLPGVFFWTLRIRPDAFHINDITMGYLCLILRIFNKPIIVHRRTLFHHKTNLKYNINAFAIRKFATKVVSICKSYNEQPLVNEKLSTVKNIFETSDGENLTIYNPEISYDANPHITIYDPEVANDMKSVAKLPIDKFLEENNLRSKKIILFIGSMGANSQHIKGQSIFERAMAILRASNRNEFIGIIVGGIKQEKPLINDNLIYFGTATDVDVFYAQATLLTIPFIINHCARQIFEGFKNRVPIIASDLPCLSELIIENETGFLVEPRNPEKLAAKILEVIEDESALSRIKENGFDMFLKIQKDTFEKTFHLFNSVLIIASQL